MVINYKRAPRYQPTNVRVHPVLLERENKEGFVDSVTLYSREIVGGVTRTLSPSPNGGLFPQHYSSMLGA